ncbi:DUF1999 domain-containing protein [Deinococcus wulumuqiensis]|uniref:DUF1999 domain-containing protein n=1 Tax=Deinococcus wulumuqiensis TaxID=980427 RepID=A0A345IG38_9DEIO|nr:DUF1999 domain-containing protein [Deinococcus wulumuqiensis]AXG98660.1 DUF1999 domain-containing protein [Deinococcus wulumuqiensis]
MTLFRYRAFTEPDFETMQALDLAAQRREAPGYDTLPEREREGRLSSSLAALRHYERSGHSFVAEDHDDRVRGYVLAQSVWQGDRPALLVRALVLDDAQDEDMRRGLLRAVVKSAYDTAVYEVHLPVSPELRAAAQAEEAHLTGHYAVIHLGTRAESAPGEKLRREG